MQTHILGCQRTSLLLVPTNMGTMKLVLTKSCKYTMPHSYPGLRHALVKEEHFLSAAGCAANLEDAALL